MEQITEKVDFAGNIKIFITKTICSFDKINYVGSLFYQVSMNIANCFKEKKKKVLKSFSNLKKIHKPRLSKIEGRVVQTEN